MNYLEVWFYDSRPRMKVFFCYFLLFLTIFIFSDVMVYLYTKSMYQPMTGYDIIEQSPEIKIILAEASSNTGNVKGTIKNNTSQEMEEQYIKLELYSPRDVKMGTKYIKINNLKPNEQVEFETGFKYDNVSSVKVSIATSEDISNATPGQLNKEGTYGPSGMILGVISSKIFSSKNNI